jgi:septum formation protein
MIGYEPEVRVADITEVRNADESPEAYVQRLSREKALEVRCAGDELVLSADTTVVVQQEGEALVLEKPESEADALRMIGLLAGKRHEVMTGFSLRYDGTILTRIEVTVVEFAALNDEEMLEYASSGEPMGKAGGYAIQGLAARFVRRVEGCYNNVVGLPTGAVYQELRRLPFDIRA